MKINNGPFKALGIWYAFEENQIIKLNCDEKIKKMLQLTNIWKMRKLSLKGKVTIIKNLILPQIQFLFNMIYIPECVLKKIDEILFGFLWDHKPPKIKRTTIIQNIDNGGLGMVDVYAVNKAAKCGWVKRLLDNNIKKMEMSHGKYVVY